MIISILSGCASNIVIHKRGYPGGPIDFQTQGRGMFTVKERVMNILGFFDEPESIEFFKVAAKKDSRVPQIFRITTRHDLDDVALSFLPGLSFRTVYFEGSFSQGRR